jgi:molybdopterin-guanine dinucleotide biosynthesis protein A
MGSPKQHVQDGMATLGSHALAIARECCIRVLVAGPPGAIPGEATIADLPSHEGYGPLAGIEAMLASGLAERWLMVPCDMPDLRGSDAQRLLDSTGQVCCFSDPKASTEPLPLPMALNATLLPSIRAYLDTNRRAVRGWLATIDCMLLNPPDAHTLRNVNEPKDLSERSSPQSP